MLAPLPPYALAAPSFPFRHLAALAGRAPIGGAREVALACFVAARLASERVSDDHAPAPTQLARCSAAKGWAGTMTLPATLRTPLLKCLESSGSGKRSSVARDLAALASAATAYLDPGSLSELEALEASLR